MKTKGWIAVSTASVLTGCYGSSFVQPGAKDLAPENQVRVEAVNWKGQDNSGGFWEAAFLSIWDSKQIRLYSGLGEAYYKVTLKPDAYRIMIKCRNVGFVAYPQVSVSLQAGQTYRVHCEPDAQPGMVAAVAQDSSGRVIHGPPITNPTGRKYVPEPTRVTPPAAPEAQ